MQWILMEHGVATGPYDTAQVASACRERRLSSAAYLREEPGGTWQRADQGPFSEFFPTPAQSVSMGRVFFAIWLILALVALWIR